MARLARVVIPGVPHDITQRGNRRQPAFFDDEDYAAYLELMADGCREENVPTRCFAPNRRCNESFLLQRLDVIKHLPGRVAGFIRC